jgi:hypothetical protein
MRHVVKIKNWRTGIFINTQKVEAKKDKSLYRFLGLAAEQAVKAKVDLNNADLIGAIGLKNENKGK